MNVIKLEQIHKNKIKKYSKELLKCFEELSEETIDVLDVSRQLLGYEIPMAEMINHLKPALKVLSQMPKEESP